MGSLPSIHFLRPSNFLVAAGHAFREEEIPWESKEMPRHPAQLGAVGVGASWASVALCLAPSSGCSSQSPEMEECCADWILQQEPPQTKLPSIHVQLLYMCSSQPSALSRALIKHRPCGRHCARYTGPIGRDLLGVCLPGKMKSG